MRGNKRTALKAALFFTALLFCIRFIAQPLYEKNQGLIIDIAAAEKTYARYVRTLAHRDRIQERYRKLFSGYTAPDNNDPAVEIFKTLEAMARGQGLSLVDIRQSEKKSLKEYGTRIELFMRGEEESFIRFIYSLNGSRLFFRIRQFTLTPLKEGGLEGRFLISYIPTL